jgi:hypothetical protein
MMKLRTEQVKSTKHPYCLIIHAFLHLSLSTSFFNIKMFEPVLFKVSWAREVKKIMVLHTLQ